MSLASPVTEDAFSILHSLEEGEGSPRDLNTSQAATVRALFERTDGAGLWTFGYYVCGLTKLTPHLHMDICEFLSQWGEPGWRRLLMMIPRGSFKTSLGSKALPLWLITRDPTLRVGMFNAAQDQAKSWVGSIRQIMENSLLYHQLWPERLPPGLHYREREQGKTVPRSWKWGDTGLSLPNDQWAVSELTVEPFGIGGSSTGKHYTHRIMDDLIGETAAQSPAIIEDAIHFIDHARALEAPPNGGCELVNCTPWAYRDCYSHLLSKWPDDYRVYRRSLLENPITGEPDVVNGESIFPESISTEVARKMHAEDPFVFSSQYQCIPKAGKETSFQAEWVRPVVVEILPNGEPGLRIPRKHYDPLRVHGAVSGEAAPDLTPLYWCDRAIMLDPAPSKRGEQHQEPRARNGIVVVACDPWGRYYTLDECPLREDPLTVLENVVRLAREWKVRKVGIEEVNFSKLYAPMWSAILRHRHPDLSITFCPLLPKGEDKDTRIRTLMAPHREGLWYYNLDRTPYTIQELLEYPHAETRDQIDAQAYFPQILRRLQTPTELEAARYAAYDDHGRDTLTGY